MVRPPSNVLEITWATLGPVASPMGLQNYEAHVVAAITARAQTSWNFRVQRFGGLRAPHDVDTRIPAQLLGVAPAPVARALGAFAYRKSRYVHRFDLRLPPPSVPEVVTIHDLPPLRFPDEGRPPPWAAASARRARLVICPSTFAAEEVQSLFGVRSVAVIPNGVSEEFVDPDPFTTPELLTRGVKRPFILHAGGATERKNLVGLAGAWRSAGSVLRDHELVLLGPPDPRRDAAFAGVDRVVQLGHRPSGEVARFMATAQAVVVPSTYEGFGLPALEAMTAGAPLVASSAGALSEVCADAALLVPPTARDLAEGLIAICSDASMRASNVAKGKTRSRDFSWSRSAEGHLRAYHRAFD